MVVASIALLTASLSLVATDAKLVVVGAPNDGDMLEETKSETRSRRRRLNGKKGGGGKKGGSNCETSDMERTKIYDGEENPMVCDFPVLVQDVCFTSQGQGMTDSAISWNYFASPDAVKVVNLDTHKTYYSPPTAFSVRADFSEEGLIFLTYIGAAVLIETHETTSTGSDIIPDGPNIIYFEGYLEGIRERSTKVQSNTVVDATVVDVCAMLA